MKTANWINNSWTRIIRTCQFIARLCIFPQWGGWLGGGGRNGLSDSGWPGQGSAVLGLAWNGFAGCGIGRGCPGKGLACEGLTWQGLTRPGQIPSGKRRPGTRGVGSREGLPLPDILDSESEGAYFIDSRSYWSSDEATTVQMFGSAPGNTW